MLFNSVEFICLFLPVALIGYFGLGTLGRPSWAILWLIGMSLVFYAYWNVAFVPLLVLSVVANYFLGRALTRHPSRRLLFLGVGANLVALGWFKYSGFFIETLNSIADAGIPLPQVVLPLAISFYTFQQIAYLVDAYDGQVEGTNFANYCLFILFFPQLIAGPIVHHREMLKQYDRPEIFRPNVQLITIGITGFFIGLFKKVVLADSFDAIADMTFATAADGWVPTLANAWIGATAFALQLYFDFSGYSDMAIGLGLMFGLYLPINFAAPFKSASIIEFWTRWHITLSRFLTAYLYNPIVTAWTRRRAEAGKPLLRRSKPAIGPFLVLLAAPTLITMTLAGVWHGAGWQFLVFGLLHGIFLVINHAWRTFRGQWRVLDRAGERFRFVLRPVSILVTFVAVTLTLVFFRATSLSEAVTVVQGMAGLRPFMGMLDHPPRTSMADVLMIAVGLAIVWILPNTQQWLGLMASQEAESETRLRWWSPGAWHWQPSLVQGTAVGALICLTLIATFSVTPSEFLYFTF